MSHRITLPAMFWRDHQERDLPAGDLVRDDGGRVIVSMTDAELDEVESDAKFYADPDGPDEQPRGLRASAKRTVAAIKRYRDALAR